MISKRSIAATVLLSLHAWWAPVANGAVGTPAPDFSLRNLAGVEESLQSHSGKLILLSFWATWCPPCREEMPAFESLYRDFESRGFVVVGIASVSQGEFPVKRFVQEMELTFPVLLDTAARVTNLYRVRFRPTTYFIDANGVLIGRVVGARDWTTTEWREFIQTRLPQPEGWSQDGPTPTTREKE